MKRIAILIVTFFGVVNANFSQTITEIRQMRYEAIGIFDTYHFLILKLDNPDVYTKDNFTKLFEDKATIYNDILPENQPQALSPEDYYDRYVSLIKTHSQLSNLELSFPEYLEGKWQVKVKFKKEINLKYKNIDLTYPKFSLNYEMAVVMDKNEYYIKKETYSKRDIERELNKPYINGKIINITVEEPLNEYLVIENMNNLPLEYSGTVIEDWDNDLHSRILPFKREEISNITVENSGYFYPLEFKQNQVDNHFYSFQKLKKNVVGWSINYTPLGLNNNITSTNFSNIQQKNQAIDLELFYGFQLAQKDKSTWFFNLKFDVNAFQDIFQGNYYTEYNTIDADNDPYLRKIKISAIEEKTYIFSTSFQPSFEYLFRISKRSKKKPMFISLEIGGFIESRLLATNKFNFTVDYTGLYNYYGGVEFDHYYDYGHFDLSNKDITQDLQQKLNKLDYGNFGSIGLLFAINKSNLLKINVGYKQGFTSPLKYKENFIISERNDNYESLLQNVNKGIHNIFIGLSWTKTLDK